jgi:4-hydroxy-tetrahydrodipicolinate synthase
VPDLFSRMVHLAMDGNFADARDLHYQLLDLLDGNFLESNPIPVKTAMGMMGLLTEHFRLPLVPMQEANRQALRNILVERDLIRD